MTRKFWIAAAAMLAGMGLAGPAAAQQRVWQDGRWVVMSHGQSRPQTLPRADRWGPVVDGRWDAGNRAPGGWSAYRRPVRGWSLPKYWRDSRFRVADYLSFGLASPPYGYSWVRYYDDAVLVDSHGRVWDSMGGVSWSGAAYDAVADNGYGWSESRAPVAGAGYPPPPPRPIQSVDPNAYYREPGAYLAPQPGYDAEPARVTHHAYPAGGYASPVVSAPPAVQVQTYTVPAASYGYGASYASGGYAYAGGGASTTVVVIPAAAASTTTTTTTTEYVTTHYVRAAAKRVVHRAPVRRPRVVKCCVCGCR